ncbi:MAG TPA: hypothetical protein VF529_09515 [Solirubrobacteraceae bacterium]|jgi:hypothetical protein
MPGTRSDEPDFAALSLVDLLEARDQYHVHLVRQRNVIATAVGRYLVRDEEGEAAETTLAERLQLRPGARPPRTLENSSVRSWSWPCVICFVDRWMDAKEIRADPDAMVPRRLYLADGRMVPTCVVLAPPASAQSGPEGPALLSFPTALMGGGYACLSDVQGQERVGSIACIVSDGVGIYALTNRHVAGPPGQEVSTLVQGTEVRVGRAAGRSVNRVSFADAYPGFAGRRMELAIDAGLIEIEDVQEWTTQVFGVGRLGEMLDLGPESLSLGLVGHPVRAFGGASGALSAEVAALYYRFRTRSGVEHVADAVVGPRAGDPPLLTRPGDSGTLWVLDDELRDEAEPPTATPLAMQWGGHRFRSERGTGATPYALVTFLSTACRALDVEPVYDWHEDRELYWGEVGHYTIGARACDLVKPAPLRKFFEANRQLISFDVAAIASGAYKTGKGVPFYPLADVPDTVWKQRTPGFPRPREGPNHFADMDDPLAPDDPITLLSMFERDAHSVTPQKWLEFYERKGTAPRHMGLLPFRVAQLYRLVVESLRDDDLDAALAAAGVMAHYVGDACQPLHTSHFHDGRNEDEAGVHSDYETAMVTSRRADVIAGLDAVLADAAPLPVVAGHRDAAKAVVALMHRTVGRLSPIELLDAWVETERDDVRGHSNELWAKVGAQTIECIADGCRTLAMLWSSAWKEADAKAPPATALDRDAMKDLYMDPSFAPSMYLPEHVSRW